MVRIKQICARCEVMAAIHVSILRGGARVVQMDGARLSRAY